MLLSEQVHLSNCLQEESSGGVTVLSRLGWPIKKKKSKGATCHCSFSIIVCQGDIVQGCRSRRRAERGKTKSGGTGERNHGGGAERILDSQGGTIHGTQSRNFSGNGMEFGSGGTGGRSQGGGAQGFTLGESVRRISR